MCVWQYEALRLKLADGAWFMPDFVVIWSDDRIECHECKGFMREAARLRLLVAAERYPWLRFRVVRRGESTGEFDVQEVRR